MRRGEIWWAHLRPPVGSEPGYRRPVLIVQSDDMNLSRLATAIVAAVTSKQHFARAPGNVIIPEGEAGLRERSVVNMSQILTINRSQLLERTGSLNGSRMAQVDEGLRTVLSLIQ